MIYEGRIGGMNSIHQETNPTPQSECATQGDPLGHFDIGSYEQHRKKENKTKTKNSNRTAVTHTQSEGAQFLCLLPPPPHLSSNQNTHCIIPPPPAVGVGRGRSPWQPAPYLPAVLSGPAVSKGKGKKKGGRERDEEDED